jgi:hypothetical protein
MRVRVASGVLRGSLSIRGNTLPVECGFIQHVGEGGEEWRGGPLDVAGECEHYAMAPVPRATARDRPYHTRVGRLARPCMVGARLAPALPTLLHSTWTRRG